LVKKIVVIGGGNGAPVVLSGLKANPGLELSVIVSVFDSGTSTGRLRRDFSIPALGDIRKCLVSLSSAPAGALAGLFQHRFQEGELAGHSLGNLMLLGLLKGSKDLPEAVEKAMGLLEAKGTVCPASLGNSHIVAEFEDGKVVEGETLIDVAESDNRDPRLRVKNFYSKPPASAFEGAIEAVREADLVVIGPGDLYTSVLANFAAKGLPEALQEAKAKKAYVCNTCTKPGETFGMTASEHVSEILKYTGLRKLDFVVVNSRQINAAKVSAHAEVKGQEQVRVDEEKLKRQAARVVLADVISEEEPARHDAGKLAKVILSL